MTSSSKTTNRRNLPKKSLVIDASTGKFFSKKRKAAEMSLATAAKYLGISITLLHEYETGVKSFPLHQIYAYSNLLNIEPDLIVELLDPVNSSTLKRVR